MTSILPWIALLLPLAFRVRHNDRDPAAADLERDLFRSARCSGSFHLRLHHLLPADTLPRRVVSWINLGPIFSVPLGLTLDPLSRSMLFMVTGVGSLIHIYSLGYMGEDEGKSRYFAGLSLFMFSMLGIVLANNFVMMFIFWELVGFSSYLLIGHWFERASAAEAAKKAFITNRLGDFGFMLGILMVWSATGSFVFGEIADGHGEIRSGIPAI